MWMFANHKTLRISIIIAVNSSSSVVYTLYILGDTLYQFYDRTYLISLLLLLLSLSLFCAIAVDANVSHRLRCCHSIVTYYRCHCLNVRRSEDTTRWTRLWTFQFEIKISEDEVVFCWFTDHTVLLIHTRACRKCFEHKWVRKEKSRAQFRPHIILIIRVIWFV